MTVNYVMYEYGFCVGYIQGIIMSFILGIVIGNSLGIVMCLSMCLMAIIMRIVIGMSNCKVVSMCCMGFTMGNIAVSAYVYLYVLVCVLLWVI